MPSPHTLRDLSLSTSSNLSPQRICLPAPMKGNPPHCLSILQVMPSVKRLTGGLSATLARLATRSSKGWATTFFCKPPLALNGRGLRLPLPQELTTEGLMSTGLLHSSTCALRMWNCQVEIIAPFLGQLSVSVAKYGESLLLGPAPSRTHHKEQHLTNCPEQ